MAVSSAAKLKTVAGESVGDLLQELIQQMDGNQLQSGDVTVAQLAKAKGISIDGARKFLNRQVRSGQLVKVLVHVRGGLAYAYRRPTS